jgi:multiple sugar transport system substrate-binding protein
MKNKMIVFVLLLSLILASCGGTPSTTDTAASPADQEVTGGTSSSEGVTLRVWTHQNISFNSGYEALAAEYMRLNPNVKIVFETFDYDTYIQTLQTALPAKTEADIMQMFGSWVCSYAEGGNLAEIPASVASKDEIKGKLLDAPLGGYICNDKLYGVPQEFNIEYGAVLFNTQIADEVGATNYKDGWASWDEAIEDLQKMAVVQDGVMTRAGLHFTGSDGIATMFHSLYLQNGGQYLKDGTYIVNTPEGLKTLEQMKRLVDAGLVDPILYNDEENWVGDSYFAETSAAGLIGPWAIPEYSGDFADVAEVTIYQPLPAVGGKPVFAAASGWGLTVSANSKVQTAAWDFIKFVTLDSSNALKWNLASGTLPAVEDDIKGDNAKQLVGEFPYFEPFLGILEYGQYEGQFPDRDFVWYEVVYKEVLNYLQGNATAEETLRAIEKAVQGSF